MSRRLLERFFMSHKHNAQILPAAIAIIALLIGMSGRAACAYGTGVQSEFEEHRVEFHNQDVKLAGSLLLPRSEGPVPAVVFVHGAGPQTREPYREAGEFFARQGIAALIYDKRGIGQSGGTYESRRPYENLVKDALSAIVFLKQHPEIAPSQIGMWGLSQGAEISAAAANRTDDIRFIIAVGASITDDVASMYFYRDNLFRKYRLSATLRDLAEKAHLAQMSLSHDLQGQSLLRVFAPRAYSPPDQYVHPAWSHVRQPVLVMWGQLDQHQPVGESLLGLKNSLAKANNDKWTMIIWPRAKHSLGSSETGAIQEKWRGYPPGALKTMTDWTRIVLYHPARIATTTQEGVAQVQGVHSKIVPYENLRWYGNAIVQAALLILFLISFPANTIAGIRCGLTRLFRRRQGVASQASDEVLNFRRALCALNLLILVGTTITVQRVADQMHPGCPPILIYLPLLGTVSTLATFVLLIQLARTPRDHGWTAARRARFSFDVLCLVLFVPYMFYWNLIGVHF